MKFVVSRIVFAGKIPTHDLTVKAWVSVKVWHLCDYSISPKLLKIVMQPVFRHKHMNHNRPIVDYNPACISITVIIIRFYTVVF